MCFLLFTSLGAASRLARNLNSPTASLLLHRNLHFLGGNHSNSITIVIIAITFLSPTLTEALSDVDSGCNKLSENIWCVSKHLKGRFEGMCLLVRSTFLPIPWPKAPYIIRAQNALGKTGIS